MNVALAINDESIAQQQYDATVPEMKSLPQDQVKQINLPIVSTIATVLGVLPKLQPYRDQVAGLSGYDIKQFDDLERYVGTMSQAEAYHTIASQPPSDLAQAQQEGAELRDVLFTDAQVLVRRGLIAGVTLNSLKGAVGYKNLAADLQSLSTLFFSNWDKISSTTSVKQDEILKAQQLSYHLYRGAGQREQSPEDIAETADIRARAFTLLTNAYDNIRRAIIFLRWHEGDADLIAPSLFAGRSNGRRKGDNTSNKPVTPTTDSTATANPGNPTNASNSAPPNAADISARGPFV